MWAQKYRLSHINMQWKWNGMPLLKMKMFDSKWRCGSIKGTQGISSWDFSEFSVMFHYWRIVINHSPNGLWALSSSEHLLLGEIDEKCFFFDRSAWDIVEISSVIWEFLESERHQQKQLHLHSQICVISTITLFSKEFQSLGYTSHFRCRWCDY